MKEKADELKTTKIYPSKRMKKALKIVLDTSIFVNPDSRIFFGKSPHEALNNFLQIIKNKQEIHYYTPPSVYAELMKFMGGRFSPKETTLIQKKPPSSYTTPLPSLLFYEFIEEMRSRINKGLRIAEKYSQKSLKVSAPNKDKEEEIIKSLRQEYRTALREGIIDSKEDFDLVLLAKEIDAHLATSDNGLIKWASKLGITCLSAKELTILIEK